MPYCKPQHCNIVNRHPQGLLRSAEKKAVCGNADRLSASDLDYNLRRT